MKNRICLFVASIVLGLTCSMGTASAVERVRMVTNLGNIDIVLFDDVAPVAVANFLSYVKAKRYVNILIHRSIPGFVIQGGGYYLGGTTIYPVSKFDPIVNEFHLSNVRGTIAMAKLPDNPNSATSEWFFNLVDNSANLDSQNGGFTAFGEVTTESLEVMDAIAAVPAYDASQYLGSAFTNLPLLAPSLSVGNLVMVKDIILVGDVDNDKEVNLTDAIHGLQAIAGNAGQTPTLNSEINGDGRIGIEEIVYILQKAANLR